MSEEQDLTAAVSTLEDAATALIAVSEQRASDIVALNAQVAQLQTDSAAKDATIADLQAKLAAAAAAPAPASVPAPAPTPAPATVPNKLQNMVLQDGVYVSVSPFPGQNAALMFNVPDVGPGKKLTVDFSRALQGVGGGNEKLYRMWDRGQMSGGQMDFYFGQPYAGWIFGFFENVFNGNLHIAAKLPPFDGQFHDEHLEFVFPSAPGAADGSILWTVDGQVYAKATGVQMDNPDKDALYTLHCIQFDTPNWDPTGNPFMKVKADSIHFLVA